MHKEGKVHPITYHDGREKKYRYSSILSLTLVLDENEWLMPFPGSFNSEN